MAGHINGLRPSDQRNAMVPAVVENPLTEVRVAQGTIISNGSASNSQSISVKVEDASSGPGRWLCQNHGCKFFPDVD